MSDPTNDDPTKVLEQLTEPQKLVLAQKALGEIFPDRPFLLLVSVYTEPNEEGQTAIVSQGVSPSEALTVLKSAATMLETYPPNESTFPHASTKIN